ncbi:MAG: serine hydrolase domain-containing protein [Flavobacteriales bacterium]
MKRIIALLLIHLLLFGCSENEKRQIEAPKIPLNDKLDAYLQAHAKNGDFNGSILISVGDSILYRENYGLADRENNRSIGDSTRFLIGSITKPFVSMCILLLEQDGKLSLENSLSEYFPDFPRADEVTIRHLLTHTSGIRDYHDFIDWKERSQSNLATLDVIEQVKTNPYRFNPGESFRYSNTGYILLGLIIEQITNESFAAYLQHAVLSPLSLANTGVITNDSKVPFLAKGYVTSPKETKHCDYINYNQPFTSGNMYSTVADLVKFAKAVMTNQLLPSTKTKEMFENNSGFYGYGWGIRDFDGSKAYGHYGGMNGFWGSLTYVPEPDIHIVFLTNDECTPKTTITNDLVSILKGQSPPMPGLQKYIAYSDSTCEHVKGDYLIKEGDTLHVYSADQRYFMQETGQIPYELFQVGRSEFAFILHEYTAHFSADSLTFKGLVNFSANRIH